MTRTDDTADSALAQAPDLEGLTVAVTGANGFVGARTCQLLSRAGADVRALVRREDTAPTGDGITEVLADLDGSSDLAGALDGADVVVHTAAIAGPDLEAARAVNVEGTKVLLSAAATAEVPRLVHVSTAAVYASADDDTPLDEDAPLVEDADEAELTTVVLRPPAILGWSSTSTWGQKVPAWVRDGELPMEPDRRGSYSWVHVDDFAAAIAMAVVDGTADGGTYVVSSENTDWGTYLGRVHSWFPEAPDPFVDAEDEPRARRLTAQRIADELGWRPTVGFEDAMAEIESHHT